MMNVRTNFLHYLFRLRAVAVFALAIILSASVFADQKLKVFILAGQSNTVGHARGHTIATLYKNGMTKDKDLVRMVFSKDMSKEFEEQLIKARKLDELSGGIGLPKIKNMPDGPEKKALESKLNKLVADHESYQKKIIGACTISDQVYISSIADRNVKSGKLGVGYGADNIKIGPEYGFGLSMAQKIKGPILLIKASWGGKSLMYDFRPPSASDFKSTKAYADAKTKAEENLVKFREAVKNFPETEKKYAADLAAYREKMKTADEKTKKKLREPRKPKLPREPKPFSQDDAGHFWREMVEHVNEVLADPMKHHPEYDPGQGYEIAGFVWFQATSSTLIHGNYADNMKTFIKDVRTSFKTPNMPFVIGVLGTPRTQEKVDENAVSIAQRKAAQHSEFRGNVLSVESYKDYSNFSHSIFEKGWPPHFHEWNTVGSDRPYHYLGSGAFFVRLGDSFANAMYKLMATKK